VLNIIILKKNLLLSVLFTIFFISFGFRFIINWSNKLPKYKCIANTSAEGYICLLFASLVIWCPPISWRTRSKYNLFFVRYIVTLFQQHWRECVLLANRYTYAYVRRVYILPNRHNSCGCIRVHRNEEVW